MTESIEAALERLAAAHALLPVRRTPRLVLRPWREDDRAPFAALNADPEVMEAMFELLETQRLLESGAPVTLLPVKSGASAMLAPLLAAQNK